MSFKNHYRLKHVSTGYYLNVQLPMDFVNKQIKNAESKKLPPITIKNKEQSKLQRTSLLNKESFISGKPDPANQEYTVKLNGKSLLEDSPERMHTEIQKKKEK